MIKISSPGSCKMGNGGPSIAEEGYSSRVSEPCTSCFLDMEFAVLVDPYRLGLKNRHVKSGNLFHKLTSVVGCIAEVACRPSSGQNFESTSAASFGGYGLWMTKRRSSGSGDRVLAAEPGYCRIVSHSVSLHSHSHQVRNNKHLS